VPTGRGRSVVLEFVEVEAFYVSDCMHKSKNINQKADSMQNTSKNCWGPGTMADSSHCQFSSASEEMRRMGLLSSNYPSRKLFSGPLQTVSLPETSLPSSPSEGIAATSPAEAWEFYWEVSAFEDFRASNFFSTAFRAMRIYPFLILLDFFLQMFLTIDTTLFLTMFSVLPD